MIKVTLFTHKNGLIITIIKIQILICQLFELHPNLIVPDILCHEQYSLLLRLPPLLTHPPRNAFTSSHINNRNNVRLNKYLLLTITNVNFPRYFAFHRCRKVSRIDRACHAASCQTAQKKKKRNGKK